MHMASSLKTKHRKQIRGFILIWAGVTFIMAAVTFIAIYMTYGSLTPPGTNLRNVAIPSATTEVAQLPTSTPTAGSRNGGSDRSHRRGKRRCCGRHRHAAPDRRAPLPVRDAGAGEL
jgi:hypothetical protein